MVPISSDNQHSTVILVTLFRWCHIEKYNRISHTVVFVIEGISLYDFQSHESLCTKITEIFPNKVEVVTPVTYSGNLIQELAAVPLTGTQRNRLLKRKFYI